MKRFLQSLRVLPRWIILVLDVSILFFSVVLAYLLRFNFEVSQIEPAFAQRAVGIYLLCHIVVILFTQSYAGIIRYTSLEDGLRLLLTTTLGSLFATIISLVYYNFNDRFLVPLSVIGISYFVANLALFCYRLTVKYIFTYYNRATHNTANVLVLGTGKLAMLTKQVIQGSNNQETGLRLVGFISYDKHIAGKLVEGTKVFAYEQLDKVLQKLVIDEIILADEDQSVAQKNELVEHCLPLNIKVRTLPPAEKWVKGELSLGQIKEIAIDDLLGREAIELNSQAIQQSLSGKTVMITGAAGSIGSEIARQAAESKPTCVVLIDQAESALYDLEQEMRGLFPALSMHFCVADVTRRDRLNTIMEMYRPAVVFHAAAYKHVPLMEQHPEEAVLCNVLGTMNVADLALEHKVEKFVMISTDKAVNPTNVMGASKRIAEMYVQALSTHNESLSQRHTKFITTRFGNVLGSNGSVIPLFKRQIANGGPLTVTHPEVTRYFMTIAEACQLVLEAAAMGNGGEIYIFDMGLPVKIANLARTMIRLSGLQEDTDIQIVYTGLREGEKLYEELLNNKENTLPTHHEKIMIAKVIPNNYTLVRQDMAELENLLMLKDDMAIVAKMKEMVPEFISKGSRYEVLDKKQQTRA